MSMKLYVGNLPHQMSENEVQTLFSEAGYVVSAKIITDRDTGQPGGLALWKWKPRPRVAGPSL